MNNIDARAKAKDELFIALTNAGCVEGITLSPSELNSITRTLFWHGVLRNENARQKPNYVTYTIPSSDILVKADDDAFLREVIIALDIFSKHSFDTKQNQELLEALETQLDIMGFEVEFSDEIFEQDTKLFHYPITLYKFY